MAVSHSNGKHEADVRYERQVTHAVVSDGPIDGCHH